MGRRLGPVLFVVVLIATGCGGGDGSGGSAVTTAGTGGDAAQAAVVLPVGVDALPKDFSASLFAFFPKQLSARPGDTIQFTATSTGEPHTVAFGTIVDEALTALAAVPAGTPVPAEVSALLNKAPAFFAPTATNVDADPQPGAAQPCFLATGAPPAETACADQPDEQPAFDGTQSFYASGFLPDEAEFNVKLAADIKPGTYRFMCLADRSEMSGTLTVVAPGQTIESPAEVRKRGEAEMEAAVEKLRPKAEQVKAITAPDAAVAGAPHDPDGAGGHSEPTVNVFPDEIVVPTGGTVTWTVNGAHIIAFNAPEDARPLYALDDQGVVKSNKKGAFPAGSPARVPGSRSIDAGQFDGSGFRSSGLLVGEGDLTWKMAFTKPGTYQYKCLFHTDMEGSVKVG